MKYPIIVTRELFINTLGTNSPAAQQNNSCGLGASCVIAAKATHTIRNVYAEMDPGFKTARGTTLVKFEIDEETERHILTYSYGSYRRGVLLNEQDHAIVREATQIYDAYRSRAINKKEAIALLKKLAPFKVSIDMDPENDEKLFSVGSYKNGRRGATKYADQSPEERKSRQDRSRKNQKEALLRQRQAASLGELIHA